MGSKNQIAEWVVANLPTAKHFYDLFAGGCAITHPSLSLERLQSLERLEVTLPAKWTQGELF